MEDKAPHVQEYIEISGSDVVLKINGIQSKKIPVEEFVLALQRAADAEVFPGILPNGVKYVMQKGMYRVVVVEQSAMPRGVYVITDDSPVPYGSGVKSKLRWLSFPYVCLMILFYGDALSGYQQIFYTAKPLTSFDDELLLCNLPNVSTQGPSGLPYWFCSQYIGRVTKLSWAEKINKIVNHLWRTGFNWSSDIHEGLSQFNAMKELDERISTFEKWEMATKEDHDFALKVNWKSSGMNLKQAIKKLFEFATPPKLIKDVNGIADLLSCIETKNSKSNLKSTKVQESLNFLNSIIEEF
jgi:hypothetical protein